MTGVRCDLCLINDVSYDCERDTEVRVVIDANGRRSVCFECVAKVFVASVEKFAPTILTMWLNRRAKA